MDVSHCYLDGNVDAVEFCPRDSFHHVLAASTYNLQEGEKPSRLGSISLFHVDAEKGVMDVVHRVETCGIFDIKWNPVGSSSCPLLGQADANGDLRVYKLEVDSQRGSGSLGNTLREVSDVNVSTSMCLYLDWNPSGTAITVGLSDGSVSVVSMTESRLSVDQQWEAHQFEVWTSTFDCHLPYLVYTGSDDCRFCGWDMRDDPLKAAAFQNTKAHSAGVCCIVKNPSDPNILLTGSYDEYLRVWDMRLLSKPVNETCMCLGGGVWRMKYHPSVCGLVLTACMHNGFAIVDTKGSKVEIIETYKKHESLAYGADWQRRKVGNENVVASCSFYDKLVRVWRPHIKLDA
ncbi:unnamed protein product [Rhodiola kirilowii]